MSCVKFPRLGTRTPLSSQHGRCGVPLRRSSVTAPAIAGEATQVSSRQERKSELVRLIQLGSPSSTILDSERSNQRGEIEEAQCAVEALGSAELDYEQLEGLWRLLYTTAPDVVPLMQKPGKRLLPFLPQPRVGAIYQRFTSLDEGVVQNIIKVGDGSLFKDGNGITFTVGATFFPSGPRTINLIFKTAVINGFQITDSFETFLAPSLLPRGSLQHQLLLAIREFNLRFALPTPSNSQKSDKPVEAQGRYHLTYVDEDMLIGRAQNASGTFIFTRATMSELD